MVTSQTRIWGMENGMHEFDLELELRLRYKGVGMHVWVSEWVSGWREGLDDKIYIGKETLEVSGQVSLFQICSIYLYISL